MRPILNQAIGAFLLSKAARPLWLGGAGSIAMLFMATAFGTAPNTVVFDGKFENVIESIATPVPGEITVAATIHAREVIIQRGDNLASVLDRMGISDAEAFQFLRSDKNAGALARQLAPGKTFSAQVTEDGELHSLVFPLNGERANALFVGRSPEGFAADIQALDVEAKLTLKSATIQHSLFGAADTAGIPDNIAVQLTDIFGGDIDFHRDLRKGDKFSVIYETESHQGKTIGVQRILAAEFINDGRSYRAFWYQPENGNGGFYTAEGRSVKKAFLRSPLEFSRISSGFSNARYHPVLRETRAHRGIDYAAPTGTRVKTTGDGVIDFAGIRGGYGKVVMVRHPGNRTTVYGHLSGFATGIKQGARISQGEVIGYVGATGIATGPHLHYEFRVDGIHRNPLTIALPDAAPLDHTQLSVYKAQVADLTTQIETIRDIRIALLD
jgi:murein DD-endopeptidase MepM/ murein hydrolase activator NlpD